LALAIYFGVNPNALLKYMQPSIDQTVVELADWTKANEPAKLQKAAAPATAGDDQQPARKGLATEFTEDTEKTTRFSARLDRTEANPLFLPTLNSVSSVANSSAR
jgi:hypothetical protein